MRACMREQCDVLVVGGGPAGAAAARVAVDAGASVIVVERDPSAAKKTCGEYLCPGGVAKAREIGFGDVLDGTPLTGMRLFSPRGLEVRTRFAPDAQALSVRRTEFDPALLRASGADVIEARVEDLDPATGVARLDNGGAIEARVVIGADGRNSVVARRAGLKEKPGRCLRATMHAYFSGVKDCEPMGELHVGADGAYVGLNPGADGLVNVGYVSDLDGPLDDFEARLQGFPALRDRFRDAHPQGDVRVLGPLEVRVRRPRTGRVLLAGDAAGYIDPLTGEGLYGALVSGALAGQLAAAGRPEAYPRALRRAFGARPRMNRAFQWMLRRPRLVEFLGRRMARRPRLADAFIRVVGHVAPPSALLRALLSPR